MTSAVNGLASFPLIGFSQMNPVVRWLIEKCAFVILFKDYTNNKETHLYNCYYQAVVLVYSITDKCLSVFL